MWLEYEILKRPDVAGYRVITLSKKFLIK